MRTLYMHSAGKLVGADVQDKHKVLVLDKSEWQGIKDHLSRSQKEEDCAEKYRVEKEQIKEKSRNMTKHWSHIKQNQREQKLAERLARQKQEHQVRDQKYMQLCQEKAEEHRSYIDKCKKLISYEKDNTKSLNSALRFSEVLRERAAQIKFNKELQAIEDEKEAKFAVRIKRDVQLAEEEHETRKREEVDKKRRTKDCLLKQLQEKEELRKRQEREKILEREDLDNLKKEIDLLEGTEKEMAIKKKETAKKIFLEALDEDRKIKEAMRCDDIEEDKVIAICAAVKQKIAALRKEKEKAMKAEAVRVRDKLGAKRAAEIVSKDAAEEESLRRAVAKHEEKEKCLREKKEAYQKRLVEEMVEDHKQFLEQEERRKIKERQMRKWSLMQRFKQTEVNDRLTRDQKEQQHQTILKTRQGYDAQIEENLARAQKEKEENVIAFERTKGLWNTEDQEFLQYAKELLDESRLKGRLLMPMEHVVEEYKRKNGLVTIRKTNPSLRSRIPFGPKHHDDYPDTQSCLCKLPTRK